MERFFLQLLTALGMTQSGSIIDALSLFRKNVSLHFQGVAECAICYSILAVTPDRALPNRGCTTCKNKFHSTCLLKWFKTSNSSSCPLCKFALAGSVSIELTGLSVQVVHRSPSIHRELALCISDGVELRVQKHLVSSFIKIVLLNLSAPLNGT
jgi:hypothetical protein